MINYIYNRQITGHGDITEISKRTKTQKEGQIRKLLTIVNNNLGN